MNIPSFFRRLFGSPNPLGQPVIQVDEDGWIPCVSAQPIFLREVRIRLIDSAGGVHEGTGRRSQVIDPEVNQERWEARNVEPPIAAGRGAGITHWKPL